VSGCLCGHFDPCCAVCAPKATIHGLTWEQWQASVPLDLRATYTGDAPYRVSWQGDADPPTIVRGED
jgi:hypothetical protein